ncbi:MAG: hypothetical protein U0840_03335 [Gemmataceae bacterium]
MAVELELIQALHELREEVCQHCASHHQEEGAVCMPGDTPCGLHLPLTQLVKAMEQSTGSEMILSIPEMEPSPDHCPCPPDVLARFTAEACKKMETLRKQRERLLDTWNDG